MKRPGVDSPAHIECMKSGCQYGPDRDRLQKVRRALDGREHGALTEDEMIAEIREALA